MKLEPNKTYVIDWEKVNSLDDVKCILAALNFQFTTGHLLSGQFNVAAHLLREYDEGTKG